MRRPFRMVRATWFFFFIAILTWLCFRWLGRPSDGMDGTFEVPVPSDTYQRGKGRFEVLPNDAIPPSIRWAPTPKHFPVKNMASLPRGKARRLPRVQHVFAQESEAAKADRMVKLDTIKSVFQRSWKAYQSKAWMHDELCPISGKFKDPFNGWGGTLIDSLDMLWIMNMTTEFSEAVSAIQELDFKTSVRKDIPLKKTTMKDLGGLLSAYDISGGKHEILRNKAVELGEILMGAFDTPNHMPLLNFEWDPASASKPRRTKSVAVLAEMGTLSLEFTRLAQLTGKAKYYDAIDRITNAFHNWQAHTQLPGMWPAIINPSGCSNSEGDGPSCKVADMLSSSPVSSNDTFTLGARSDSMYEYLPKEYILLAGREEKYQHMYEKVIEVAKAKLMFRPMTKEDDEILVLGSLIMQKAPQKGESTFIPHNSHLTCYAGGMIAMAARVFERDDDLSIAVKLTNGCIWGYEKTASGIMPEEILYIPSLSSESCKWDEELWQKALGGNSAYKTIPGAIVTKKYYMLRPEVIEPVFYLYRITGEDYWREKGWAMFKSIEAATGTEFGNAEIDDVMVEDPPKRDSMQSFWMAETLKYFYLLFSREDMISLNDYVFNTEAHPLVRPKPV